MSLILFLQRRQAKNGRFYKNISTTIGCLEKSTLNRVLVNDARNIRQCWILCNDRLRGVMAVRFLGLFLSASVLF